MSSELVYPVAVVENRPTSTNYLFYCALRSLRYPVEFQEVDHPPNSLWVTTDSPDSLDKVTYLGAAVLKYDISCMLRDIGQGDLKELGAVLKGDPEAEINYKPRTYTEYRMMTLETRPLLERCFVMAYQVARRNKIKGRRPYLGLYQQFIKRDVRPLDPETIGDMWRSVILDIQAKEPDLLP